MPYTQIHKCNKKALCRISQKVQLSEHDQNLSLVVSWNYFSQAELALWFKTGV